MSSPIQIGDGLIDLAGIDLPKGPNGAESLGDSTLGALDCLLFESERPFHQD